MRRLATAAGLVAGVVLDELLGDPARGHPVAAFGRYAQALERRLHRDSAVAGAAHCVAAVVPPLLAAVVAQRALARHPVRRAAAVAAVTWVVVGGRGLRQAGLRVAAAVGDGDVAGARELLPWLCGRDPGSLDATGLTRAALESVAENTGDAVVSPLVWGAVAGLPGLVALRAVNTLDAMVGHRTPRHRRFGTPAARLDDVAGVVPARLTGALTVLVAPLLGGDAPAGLRAWRRDAAAHPSPNAGVCEASAAGVLGVRLGGRTVYDGRAEERPLLGDGRRPEPADLGRAVALSRAVQCAALCVAALVAVAVEGCDANGAAGGPDAGAAPRGRGTGGAAEGRGRSRAGVRR